MKITYAEAINAALREEMGRFPELFIIGEDICRPKGKGGAFNVTAGLSELFPPRVLNTILNESSIIGTAAGIALRGMRVVAEMQFADFVTDALKMVRDYAAGLYYRNGIKLPLVIRMPSGATSSGGAFHSICPEMMFFNVPGLIILAPSTPNEAKGLLKTAIRQDSPVIFLEWKNLYHLPYEKYPDELKLEIPEKDYTIPIGKARIVRDGKDITVVSYGNMLFEALRACDLLKEKGIEAELIDLRSLMPFDWQTVFASLEKTGRVIIAHEDKKIGGFGMTLAQMISEEMFEYLYAQPVVVGAPFTPIPHHPNLEKEYLPDAQKIVEAVMKKIFGDTGIVTSLKKTDVPVAPMKPEAIDDKIIRVPFSSAQKRVAKKMSRNWLRPHIHDDIEVDVTRIWNDREQNKTEFEGRFKAKLTLTHYFAYAATQVLTRDEFWKFRSAVEEKSAETETPSDLLMAIMFADTHLRKDFVNLAFAVDIENHDLLVPIVKNAGDMRFSELASTINVLAEKCRQKKILPDELQGGNFTLTNVGAFGTLRGNPILLDGQNASLAIGAIREADEGRKIILTLAFDHRPINGAEAGIFKQALKEFLENWSVDIFGD
ncbi:MAG: 2-oxo acid dehydrogenase subunit E2 [Candidatus Niyogibacteria bacterium]|nr:MAG: 2-oxo acid dehydrogenase subunit E2 [Candidatus Niyogibacteria bacterium]